MGAGGEGGGDADPDDAPTTNDPSTSSSPSTGGDSGDLDGNFASIDFTASAEGEDTLVMIDAYALVIEDELSTSEGFVVLAVE